MTSAIDGPPPVLDEGGDGSSQRAGSGRKNRKDNAATGASAAGVRAVSAQIVAFYFRAPIKAFFRTRVDYMAVARAINPRIQTNQPWSWHVTTAGLLTHAVRTHGWAFLPNQVLPPLLANVSIGAILYTSYLQSLGLLHEPSSRSTKRTYPPAPPRDTFTAGFVAGGMQSLMAAPLDALTVRFETNDMLEGTYRNMWHYAKEKLSTIGVRGVFAGYSMSFLKDSLGYGVFFATFEYTKSQVFHAFLRQHYGRDASPFLVSPAPPSGDYTSNPVPTRAPPTIRPHFMIEPSFIALAGLTASMAQQVIQHPISRFQDLHYSRLESLDYSFKSVPSDRRETWNLYMDAYRKTLDQARMQARMTGGWWRWCYGGFLVGTLRNVPSSAAGLVVFEIVRRRYGGFGAGDEDGPHELDGNGVRILLD